MTERDRWGLRGPVLSCRLQRIWYSRCCGADLCETEARSDTTTVEFHPNGSLARRRHSNPDGSEWTSSYVYDGSWRLVTVRTENVAAQPDLQRYEYDSEGRLVRMVARTSDGRDRIAESYEYDATGRKKKTLYVDVTAQSSDTMYFWGVEDTDCAYSAPGATALTTLYNMHDQPTELLFHDKDGRTLSRVEFVYDDTGNLVEEAQTMAADVLPAEMLAALTSGELETMRALLGAGAARRQHCYDARGLRIETHTRMFGALGRDSKRMTYNHQGDQIEEMSEYEQRDFSIDDRGRLSSDPTKESVSRSEARFRYDYDVRGNWIKKAVEARSGADAEFSLSSVEQRTIDYYD